MRIKAPATFAAIGALFAVCACSSDPSSPDRGDRAGGGIAIAGIDGRVAIIRPGQDANAAFSQGLDLKAQGNCAGAIIKLRPVANLGPGYENAQTALAACLLDSGARDQDLSSDYLEGLTWLRRAADTGWPEAQGLLARAHAFGPRAIRNNAEAAYWLALYQTNPSKSRIGFTPLAAADMEAVDKALTQDEKSAGAARALQWQRKVWLPPVPEPNGPDAERGTRRSSQRDRAMPGQ